VNLVRMNFIAKMELQYCGVSQCIWVHSRKSEIFTGERAGQFSQYSPNLALDLDTVECQIIHPFGISIDKSIRTQTPTES
jgi:hypothetical protein